MDASAPLKKSFRTSFHFGGQSMLRGDHEWFKCHVVLHRRKSQQGIIPWLEE